MNPELSAGARASRVFRATLDALCFAYYNERITEGVLAECLGVDRLGARNIYAAWYRKSLEPETVDDKWERLAENFKMAESS